VGPRAVLDLVAAPSAACSGLSPLHLRLRQRVYLFSEPRGQGDDPAVRVWRFYETCEVNRPDDGETGQGTAHRMFSFREIRKPG
jgi:hypothetical protein